MKVMLSAIQMTSGNDLQANLKQLESLLQEASSAGSQLVVLPENFAIFGAVPAGRAEARF